MTAQAPFATPVDLDTYGPYRAPDARASHRRADRITADGSSGLPAEPGRYHLYAGWSCPWSQRVMIQRALNGLEDVVSASYVDGARDGRGWAFRESTGPDPVNGFRLLSEAYGADFDGPVTVPALWDRVSGRVVGTDARTIGLDLATAFAAHGNGADTYPAALRSDIEEIDRWLGPTVNRGLARIRTDFGAWAELLDTIEGLEDTLAHSRFLLGDEPTEADVRLYVSLVRFDAAVLEAGRAPVRLRDFPILWRYARDLYQLPAFAATTDLGVVLPAGANQAVWTLVHDRAR